MRARRPGRSRRRASLPRRRLWPRSAAPCSRPAPRRTRPPPSAARFGRPRSSPRSLRSTPRRSTPPETRTFDRRHRCRATEGRYAGEFIVSEGNGKISRETTTVLSGQTLQAGAVLGKVTASGNTRRSIRPPLTARRPPPAPLRRGRRLGRRCRGRRDRAPRRSQRRRAGLAGRHHRAARRPPRSASSPRSTSSPADARAPSERKTLIPLRPLRQLRLHHGGADRAINKMPYVPGRIGQLGLFREPSPPPRS